MATVMCRECRIRPADGAHGLCRWHELMFYGEPVVFERKEAAPYVEMTGKRYGRGPRLPEGPEWEGGDEWI